MERKVFCPSENLIPEAELLANNCKLPILIGDNGYTKNLSFDRSIVQVIQIPILNYFNIGKFDIKHGFHQNIVYVNEFDELTNNVKLLINNCEIKPMYQEKYKIKFSYQCNNYGKQKGFLYLKNNLIKEFEFNVS